jgi:hypothetical protein
MQQWSRRLTVLIVFGAVVACDGTALSQVKNHSRLSQPATPQGKYIDFLYVNEQVVFPVRLTGPTGLTVDTHLLLDTGSVNTIIASGPTPMERSPTCSPNS